MTSPDLAAANIDKLAELFPSVITESLDADGNPVRAVDFDLLRQELSDHIVEGPQERYQLDWPGKRAAAFAANAPIAKTLRPVREESVDFDTTKNLFIEGDNLDALKLLQESYLGKVKLIYIDPPYNTGGDFVYRDDFSETTKSYLKRSAQIDDAGSRMIANVESSGRFHSDWLSMMFPRLRLARNLLNRDGVLVVSIDDSELAGLLMLGSEVFGRNNLLNVVAIKSSEASGVKMSHASRRLPKMKEYLVFFARDKSVITMTPIRTRKDAADASELDAYLKYYGKFIENPDMDVDKWSIVPVAHAMALAGVDPSDPVAVRSFKIQYADRVVYRTNNAALGRMKFPTSTAEVVSETGVRYVWWEGKQMLFLADYMEETLGDFWTDLSTINLNKETMGVEGFGQGQKPLALIDRLLTLFAADDLDAIVLDFFAGSGTTGHSVIARNRIDGGRRSFILVQIAERLDPKDGDHGKAIATCQGLGRPATVAELTKERLRRVSSAAPGAGFRAMKVDSTNLAGGEALPDELEQASLIHAIHSVKPDRTDEDLLFQVLLDWGLDLSERVAVEQVEGRRVLSVAEDSLIACFADEVTDAVVKEIAHRRPLRAVFLDAGFADDAARINAEQVFREVSPETEVKAI